MNEYDMLGCSANLVRNKEAHMLKIRKTEVMTWVWILLLTTHLTIGCGYLVGFGAYLLMCYINSLVWRLEK